MLPAHIELYADPRENYVPLPLSADATRRLAYMRLLLDRAIEMTSQPAPFSYDSLNRLHDVAEMFLALAAQHNQVGIPKDFMGYWQNLEVPLGRPLMYRAAMERFNKARVSLKHYGVVPAPTELAEAGLAVASLMRDECVALFGVTLDAVAMESVVACVKSRQLLSSAATKWERGEALEALADVSDAFVELVRDYENRKTVVRGTSVFDSALPRHELNRLSQQSKGDRDQAPFNQAVLQSVDALDFSIMLVGLGIDFRRYGMFKTLTPLVVRTMDGSRHVRDRSEPGHPDQHDYVFCRDFVITTAIHLADFDFDYNWGTARSQSSSVRDASLGDD